MPLPAARFVPPAPSTGAHDECNRDEVGEALCARPRAADGLRRGRRGRPDRVPPRQPDVVVPVAQRDPARRGARALHRARPDRHGRLRQAARQRPRPLHVRRASRATSTRCSRRSDVARTGHARRPRLGLGPRLRLGEPPSRRGEGHRLHGGDRPAASPGSDWPEPVRRVFQALRSDGGRGDGARAERASSSGSCPGRSCARWPTRRWTSTAGRSSSPARAAARR